MIQATENFPRDKYYQIELARAQAWGDFAAHTTKTATAERSAYRDLWLPTSAVGAEILAPVGVVTGAAIGGAVKGTAAGLVTGGAVGAVAGGVVGGIIGAGVSYSLLMKDRLMGGPPAVFYNMNVQLNSPVQLKVQIPAGNAAIGNRFT